jgi:hypothetical protein
MANVKKFDDPILIGVRVEKSTQARVSKAAKNKNDWLNEAILEKLQREGK